MKFVSFEHTLIVFLIFSLSFDRILSFKADDSPLSDNSTNIVEEENNNSLAGNNVKPSTENSLSPIKCSIFGSIPEKWDNYLSKIFCIDVEMGYCLPNRRKITVSTPMTTDASKFGVSKLQSSDASIFFVHPLSLFNEDSTLHTFQMALANLVSNDRKKPMIIFTLGLSSYLVKVIKVLLQEAWIGLRVGLGNGIDKETYFKEEVTSEFDIKIVPLSSSDPTKLTPTVVEELRRIFTAVESQDESPNAKTSSLQLTAAFNAESTIDRKIGHGVELCQSGIEEAVESARQEANKNIENIQKAEYANEFAGFVDNLVSGALKFLDDRVRTSGLDASPEILKLARVEVRRLIFVMMQPFFKRQVQLARVRVTQEFNALIAENENDLVSIHIMEILNELKAECLTRLRNAIRQLTPKDAPISTLWNVDLELNVLRDSLDDYLKNREAFARSEGILARDRKPLSLSFNWFILHPFGRDYRQDVITQNSDRLIYVPDVQMSQVPMVHPSTARSIMTEQLRQTPSSKLKPSAANYEFAREMLMFPLSVKNPGVPMSGGRSRSKYHGPPQPDPDRQINGPERYIRWDMEPLNIAKKNLEEYIAKKGPTRRDPEAFRDYITGWGGPLERYSDKLLNLQSNLDVQRRTAVRYIDSVVNQFSPWCNRLYYDHPPINYNDKFPLYASNKPRYSSSK